MRPDLAAPPEPVTPPVAVRRQRPHAGGMDPRLHDGLRQVAARGQPAQAAEARRLIEVLQSCPAEPAAESAAGHLVDAYLNDPYLTR